MTCNNHHFTETLQKDVDQKFEETKSTQWSKFKSGAKVTAMSFAEKSTDVVSVAIPWAVTQLGIQMAGGEADWGSFFTAEKAKFDGFDFTDGTFSELEQTFVDSTSVGALEGFDEPFLKKHPWVVPTIKFLLAVLIPVTKIIVMALVHSPHLAAALTPVGIIATIAGILWSWLGTLCATIKNTFCGVVTVVSSTVNLKTIVAKIHEKLKKEIWSNGGEGATADEGELVVTRSKNLIEGKVIHMDVEAEKIEETILKKNADVKAKLNEVTAHLKKCATTILEEPKEKSKSHNHRKRRPAGKLKKVKRRK